MHLVLAASLAELLQLKTARNGLLVLRRRVVPLLALGAFHRNDFPHVLILFVVRVS
jgi:hypothetical protein